jgi:hypothetical protein
MTLHNALGRKTGLLKMSIDVGREHPAAVRFSGRNPQEKVEPSMRLGATIKIQPMSIEEGFEQR